MKGYHVSAAEDIQSFLGRLSIYSKRVFITGSDIVPISTLEPSVHYHAKVFISTLEGVQHCWRHHQYLHST